MLMRQDEDTVAELTGPSVGRVRTDDGSVKKIFTGVGAVSATQEFTQLDDEAVTAAIENTLASFGLDGGVRLLHLGGPIPEISVTMPVEGPVSWTVDSLRSDLVEAIGTPEGLLMEFSSPSGDPLLVSSVNYITSEGGLWFAPGQDERFGANHG